MTDLTTGSTELTDDELALVIGGRPPRDRSSKIIDVEKGWTGVDADF